MDSPAGFCGQFDPEGYLDHPSALKSDWKSIHLLFQLTDEELARESSLFPDTTVKPSLRSYLFFAIELTGGDYARGKLTTIVRQINRVFPMPVMVLIKHLTNKTPLLSIAVINRRQNKARSDKDVLGKVTIIRDISLAKPHLHATLNAPSHPIRNRLLRISADSPDLLAVIKKEGKV